MKKFVALLGAVTVICIIVGTYIHIGGFFMKGFSLFDKPIFSTGAAAQQTDFSEEYKGAEKIDIKMAVGNVDIKEGNTVNVSYNGRDDLKPEVSFDNGKLVIKQKKDIKINAVNLTGTKCELTVTVPSNVTLKEIEADLDMGDLKIRDVSCDELEAELSMGNLEVKEVTAKKISADNKMGDCKILDSNFDKLKGNCDMGNVHVELVDDTDNYGITAKVDMGEVKIDGNHEGNSYSSKGDKTLVLNVSMGDIIVE